MPAENTVPKAVQKQVDAAEKMAKDAQAALEPESTPAPTEPTAPVEPAVIEKTEEEAPPAPETPPVESESQPEPEVAPEAPAPPQVNVEEFERLQKAHDTLVGKYSAEVPRYARQQRERDERIKELEDRIAQQAAQAAVPPVDPDNPYGLSREELELGSEVVTTAEKIAKRLTEQQAREFENRLGKTAQVEAPDNFLGTLASLVPDYDQINESEPFKQWLLERDPIYGVRNEVLQDAQAKGDGVRAANIFLAFKKASEAAVPPPEKKPPRPSVVAQVAPRTVTAPPKTAQTKPTYTNAQVGEMASRIVKGKYTPERAREVERELDAAAREGRILG